MKTQQLALYLSLSICFVHAFSLQIQSESKLTSFSSSQRILPDYADFRYSPYTTECVEEINDMIYNQLSNTVDDNAGSIGALVNNSVSCNSKNSLLQSFQLIQNNSSYQYSYKCFEHLSITDQCSEVSTTKYAISSDLKIKPLEALARAEFDMKCSDTQAIKGFTLKMDGANYYYSVKCCELLKIADKISEVYASKAKGGALVSVSAQSPTGRFFRNLFLRKVSDDFQYQGLVTRIDLL